MGLAYHTSNALQGKKYPIAWREIDWAKVKQNVREIQIRIAKAATDGRWRDVRNLQRLLARSYSARLLAVRHVTEKRGLPPAITRQTRSWVALAGQPYACLSCLRGNSYGQFLGRLSPYLS